MGSDRPKSELPIACTLNPGDLQSRQSDLKAVGRESLIEVVRGDRPPVALRFKGDPETRTKLEEIVAAEAECCAFLDMRLAGSESLELTIDGPESAQPIIDELVEAFSAETAA